MSADESPPPAAEAAGGADSFGRYLRQERELRGVSLEQIAEQTRIGVGNLRALERDELARLPARVFLLGFVRSYAEAIGLDPDEAALRFEEWWHINQPPERLASWRHAYRGPLLRRLGVGAAALAGAGLVWWFWQTG